MLGPYHALLFVSFGGPEGPDDVIPFLENVLRGKPVPRERMLEVAEHYQHFGGVSPINEQNRKLIAALEAELKSHDIDLPIYWGNRNWDPMLGDAIEQMRADGVTKALSFMTSAFSCYSGLVWSQLLCCLPCSVSARIPITNKQLTKHPNKQTK